MATTAAMSAHAQLTERTPTWWSTSPTTLPLAARQQREHQLAPAPVSTQRYGPVPVHPHLAATLDAVAYRLNSRLRKALDFQTPPIGVINQIVPIDVVNSEPEETTVTVAFGA